MGVFSDISDGWGLFTSSIRVLGKYPVLLLPLFFSWVLVAGLILYMRYYFVAPNSFALVLVYVYGFLFSITLIVSVANTMMLEVVQQIETGSKISLKKALEETFGLDLIKVIPLAAVWALVWFIIVIIRVLTSKKRGGSKSEPSAKDAARTLGGANSGPFSWLGLGLQMFEKLVRMTTFLALPAIAWENLGPISAYKRAGEIIRKHPIQFLTAYSLTGVAALFMIIPLYIIFKLDDAGMNFSTIFWVGVIVYEGLVWTLSNYLEQMTVGILYLWHLKWMKNGGTGDLSDVPKPDLFDHYHELAEYSKAVV